MNLNIENRYPDITENVENNSFYAIKLLLAFMLHKRNKLTSWCIFSSISILSFKFFCHSKAMPTLNDIDTGITYNFFFFFFEDKKQDM